MLKEHQARYTLKKGDFVIGKIGTIGQPFVLPSPFNFALSANLILVQPYEDIVISPYLVAFFSSPIAESALRTYKTDSTHAVFGIKKARQLLIPIPPLAEQHRIVAKVDELFAVCDALSEKLAARRQLSQRLMEAVAESAAASKARNPSADLQSQLGQAQRAVLDKETAERIDNACSVRCL